MGENREAGWLIVVLRFPSGALKNSALALDQLPMANTVTKDPKITDLFPISLWVSWARSHICSAGGSNEDCLVWDGRIWDS